MVGEREGGPTAYYYWKTHYWYVEAVQSCRAGMQPTTGAGPAYCSYTGVDRDKNCGVRDCPVLAGNPVNVGTGNKIQVERDYGGGTARAFEFVRTYNSAIPAAAYLGPRWRHTYDRTIATMLTHPSTPAVMVHRGDGRALVFSYWGGAWKSSEDVTDSLTRLTDGGGATIGWEYRDAADDALESYDASGRLTALTDRAGRRVQLTYSDASTPPAVAPRPGLLIGITDPFGRQLNLTYLKAERIATVTDPGGGIFAYGYDASGRLTSVTYPDGKVRAYHYNESEHTSAANLPYALTGIADENGNRYATYTYAASGRAIGSEHAGGAGKVTLSYGADSATVTDALSTARTYTFQNILGVARNTGISQPCSGCAAATTYDANGNVGSRKDFNDNLTCYAYDLTRNLETVRGEGLTAASCPANLSSWTPAGGTVERKTTTEWHATWRLPEKTCEPKRITMLAYDAQGNVTTRTIQATDDTSGAQGCSASPVGTARTWTYSYTYSTTNPGVATQIVVDGPRTDVPDTTTYVYEEATGDLLSVTNALDHVTSLGDYDAHGKPRLITDPNGVATTLAYDARQRLTSRSVGGETTSYAYDNAGQLTRVTLPDSSYIEYVYDPAHRLTEVRDSLGNKVTYTLDLMGNRTVEETRDPGGVLKAKRTREYNALNRLIKDIGGTSPTTQITQYGYDAQGNLTSIDGPLSGTPNDLTSLAYDALNRLKDTTDPLSGITLYGYDALDQVASVQDPRNNTTVYTVSGLGDQTQEVSPDRGTTNATFDAAGNQLTRTDARSKTTTSAYDALNRVSSVSFDDGTSVGFTYDQGTNGKGRLTTVTWPGGQTTYAYDARGRVTQKTDSHASGPTLTVSYDWEAATGRLTSIGYPSGQVLTLAYDAAGRVASLSVGAAPIATSIGYFPFGAPSGWTWGNSFAVMRSFDLDGRITGLPLLPTETWSVAYDDASRISAINHPSNPSLSQSYGYDRLDRLTNWVQGTSSRSYGYDANGNRSSLMIGGNDYTYTTPGSSNRLASTSGPSLARTFTYDAAGSITADGQASWTYNDRGRLASATQGSMTATYTHDGLGQRVKRTGPTSIVPTGTNYFLYDESGKLVGEYDSSGAVIQEYVYLGESLIALLRGGTGSPEIYYVYTDQVGRPWVVTNTANQVRWRWDTSPFGELPVDENPSGLGTFTLNQRFPGQYFDAETGLFYNYFRDYDPQTGRYVQSDPIGLAGGINPYLYAFDPLTQIDPFGLMGRGGVPNRPSSSNAPIRFGGGGAASGPSSAGPELTGSIGLAVTLFGGPYGGMGEWGVARDYKNTMCFYYQECKAEGGAAGLCIQGGVNFGIQRGALQPGSTQQAGFFAAGGRGLGADVQVMGDVSGNLSVVKGAPPPLSLGLGFAGGFIECTTKYVCPF